MAFSTYQARGCSLPGRQVPVVSSTAKQCLSLDAFLFPPASMASPMPQSRCQHCCCCGSLQQPQYQQLPRGSFPQTFLTGPRQFQHEQAHAQQPRDQFPQLQKPLQQQQLQQPQKQQKQKTSNKTHGTRRGNGHEKIAERGNGPVPLEPGEVKPASTAAVQQEGSVEEDIGNRSATSPEAAANSWPEGYTTVMLRNIPNRYTAEELLAEFLAAGYERNFDFFYLPMDFCTKRSRGYAFINFHSFDIARQFVFDFHLVTLSKYKSVKILEAVPAVTQGFDANVEQYFKKDAQRITNPWFRPMIFARTATAVAEEVDEDDEVH